MQAVSQAHLLKEILSGEEGRARSPRSHRVVIKPGCMSWKQHCFQVPKVNLRTEKVDVEESKF